MFLSFRVAVRRNQLKTGEVDIANRVATKGSPVHGRSKATASGTTRTNVIDPRRRAANAETARKLLASQRLARKRADEGDPVGIEFIRKLWATRMKRWGVPAPFEGLEQTDWYRLSTRPSSSVPARGVRAT